jgi:branched-chain amino acid transport system substrate-binding protein
MQISRRTLLGATAAIIPLAAAPRARATDSVIKIGVLNDQSGPYRDVSGLNSVACVKQAIQDFGASSKGFSVEVLSADHQNKPDVGAGIARQWFDRDGVDMIIDVPTSSVGLAVASVCREKNRAYINVGAGTAELTGKQCAPTTIHWAYDTWMLAHSTGGATVKAGGDSWYFLTADYVFGHDLERQTSGFVTAAGGKVLGSSTYPFPSTTDFSSYLLQAQATGAKVLGLANAGADTVNSIKQAHEFGLTSKMRIAALLMFITDVHALGLETGQGLVLTESFYWNLNAKTRALSMRIKEKTPNNMPNMVQAGCYAGSLHYMKAVADMGVAAAKASGAATIARMKAMPTEDDAFGTCHIREDGRVLVPAYLFEVKTPAESKEPWDYYKLLITTPGDQAFRPLKDGNCPLIPA